LIVFTAIGFVLAIIGMATFLGHHEVSDEEIGIDHAALAEAEANLRKSS